MSVPPAGLTGIVVVCVDADDPPALAAWWQALVGGEVYVDRDGDARLTVAGGWPIDFLRTADPRPAKNRLHLDLGSTDFDRAVRGAIELGAVRADDVYAGERWQVLRDPEGNEFCILRPGGEDVV